MNFGHELLFNFFNFLSRVRLTKTKESGKKVILLWHVPLTLSGLSFQIHVRPWGSLGFVLY